MIPGTSLRRKLQYLVNQILILGDVQLINRMDDPQFFLPFRRTVRRALSIGSAISSSRRGCRSSSGAASRTRSSSR